jgi:biuret amidohydrolase
MWLLDSEEGARMPDENLVDFAERIEPARSALLVIDMQRYFVNPNLPYGKWLSQFDAAAARYYFDRVRSAVIPNIQRLLEGFRGSRAQVVYTEFGSVSSDGRDMPGWARRHNQLGREFVGSAVYPPFSDTSCRVDDAVSPQPDELVVQKTTSGPVNSTKLDYTLRSLGIDTVVVAGVVTDVCVAQTTREFGDRDFNAIVIEDACATLDAARHEATLATIGLTFGAVLTTEQVLGRIGPPAV